MADALALGVGGHGRVLPKSLRQPFEPCRTGAADQADKRALRGRRRNGEALPDPKIQREKGYARRDSNPRPMASKAQTLMGAPKCMGVQTA